MPVRLEVFEAAGRRVRRLISGSLEAGRHEVRWDGRDGSGSVLPTGIYFVRLSGGGGQEAVKRVVRLE